jgi:hypothetical protein
VIWVDRRPVFFSCCGQPAYRDGIRRTDKPRKWFVRRPYVVRIGRTIFLSRCRKPSIGRRNYPRLRKEKRKWFVRRPYVVRIGRTIFFSCCRQPARGNRRQRAQEECERLIRRPYMIGVRRPVFLSCRRQPLRGNGIRRADEPWSRRLVGSPYAIGIDRWPIFLSSCRNSSRRRNRIRRTDKPRERLVGHSDVIWIGRTIFLARSREPPRWNRIR